MHAMMLMIGVLCVLVIAYAVYSRFLAFRVLQLDDSRQTPAYTLNDGHNYHPTNKWVLFGHHFAAISGAGPLIGPVLAAQFGYLPGLLWILIGVCLGGAVQDFTVLVLSMRRGGKSLAHIARDEIGKGSGTAAMIGILFVLVVALAGLGKVVVNALGGEQIKYEAKTQFIAPAGQFDRIHAAWEKTDKSTPEPKAESYPNGVIGGFPLGNGYTYTIPAGTIIVYPNGHESKVGAPFDLAARPNRYDVVGDLRPTKNVPTKKRNRQGEEVTDYVTVALDHEFEIKPDWTVRRSIPGSTWGAFTIFLTIPIALFVGLYMYRIRKGKVLEASIIGGVLTLGAVYLGAAVHDPNHMLNTYINLHQLADTFNLSSHGIAASMAIYGFIASILPVWLLLCPRDYLSAFLKIGTVALLVLGVILANPVLHAPALNQTFISGGPILGDNHGVLPFVFITIMCGAVSGFHSLVASGTTPKMIMKESHARPIGYGAMLIEGLVGIVALIAAASLPTAQYYHMNTRMEDLPKYSQDIVKIQQDEEARLGAGAGKEDLGAMERRVGETLEGRTGGAVTLAVGMADIFDGAARNIVGSGPATPASTKPAGPMAHLDQQAGTFLGSLEALIPYWYHFAIMFEALFILTTIDTGTRVGRFVLQELFGRISPKWGKTDYWPSAIVATGLLVLAWWYFIEFNSMKAIWPMFGIANQMLAVMALAVCTVALIRSGRRAYAWVTAVPMAFVTLTTISAAAIMVYERVASIATGKSSGAALVNDAVATALILGITTCTCVILVGGLRRVMRAEPTPVAVQA